jgi:GAF domain-containing protein
MIHDADFNDDREALAEARRAVDRLVEENQQLRAQLADHHFARELREVFSLATTAGTIAAPVAHSRLLELIVRTAEHVISARAAALFLVDEAAGELVLEVATGPKAAEVRQLRLPIGHGIAGLVAVSAQPMAISDAQRDPQHAADIAMRVGYLPTSLLCVPLSYEDQVIGVLELLDKVGASSFGLADIEALGLFAEQAAVAIEQSRTLQSLAALIGEVLDLLGETLDPRTQRLRQDAQAFARRIEEESGYQQALALARLIQELARDSQDGLAACQTIVRAFVEYAQSRTGPGGQLGGTSGYLGLSR